MNHDEPSLRSIQQHWPQTFKLYITGFILCLILTSVSFSLAAFELFSKFILSAILVFLALIQAFVQLIYFMHMGKEAKPRWMTLVFYFMVLVLLIIVLGSLWIMNDLDHRMMPNMKHW